MTDHHLELEKPYRQGDPLEMDDARRAARRVSQMRRDAEAQYRTGIDEAGQKEAIYREAIAKEIVRMMADGAKATEAGERARGNCRTELEAFRIAEGMVKAYEQRLRAIEGERSMLKSLIDWSAQTAYLLQEGREHTQGGAHG